MTPPSPSAISEILDRVLAVEPGRTALIAPSGTLSYEALDASANAAAASLRELGVRPGDRVAASLPNDLDIIVAFHGAMRLGAIWVGVNRALARSEKEDLLSAAAPSIFLAQPADADAHRGRCRVVPVDPGDPGTEWPTALAAFLGARRPPSPDPDHPAGIAFTSGTTGLPKGIVHSQRNLLLPAASLVASRGYDRSLRKGDCLPLTILNLQVLTTLLTTAAGGCCAITDRRDARGVAEWIARDEINVWNGVPAMLHSMVHDPDLDPRLLAGLREVWTGGAECPEDLIVDFGHRFGLSLRQTYGLTEAPTVVTIEPIGRTHVEGSSGVPLPHLHVGVCDDDGRDLPIGESGEIVVRGVEDGPWAGAYTPLVGYWEDHAVARFEGGGLRTGDIGRLDTAGNLFVRDRKKLVIIRGGANVYPAEVERIIERLPGVSASAVIGIPDTRLGQEVVAAVEVVAGSVVHPDQVVQHCRTHLARYKVPTRVVVVKSLPRNAMGKVQRPPLIDLFNPSSHAHRGR